jgi:hypothetical protein
MRRGLPLVIAGSAVLAATALVVAFVVTRQEEVSDLLPNLDQAAPGELSGRTGGTTAEPRFFLGFVSAAGNVGDGPLVVAGKRAGVAEPEMPLVQHIERTDGSTRPVPVRASLRYVSAETHSHWHLLGFMRYELRSAAGQDLRRDRKTGFCLGDRYKLSVSFPRAELAARFTDECGKEEPELLTMREGISVGWGDDYTAHLEGQEFDITTLPAGQYVLVHRVNPERVLRESDYTDNVSSLAFRLTWPRGKKRPPTLDVLARCPASPTCP